MVTQTSTPLPTSLRPPPTLITINQSEQARKQAKVVLRRKQSEVMLRRVEENNKKQQAPTRRLKQMLVPELKLIEKEQNKLNRRTSLDTLIY